MVVHIFFAELEDEDWAMIAVFLFLQFSVTLDLRSNSDGHEDFRPPGRFARDYLCDSP